MAILLNIHYCCQYRCYLPLVSATLNQCELEKYLARVVRLRLKDESRINTLNSAHGAWDCSTGFTLSGTSPLIEYKASGVENHSNQLTTTVGVMQPLIAWESLPVLAQTALENTDFGSAIVPFIDAHFTTNLGKCSW
jgi:hypothetical protein